MGFQFLGIISLADMAMESSRVLILLTVVCTISFIFGVCIANRLFKVRYLREVRLFREKELLLDVSRSLKVFILGMLLVSCLVCLVYYKAIGGNIFLISIKLYTRAGHLTDIAGQVKDLRLHSYSALTGEAYFAPGYVNQFKNTILPIVATTTIFYYLIFRSRISAMAAIVVSSLSVFFLIGTMQRAPLFWAVFIFCAIYLSGMAIDRKLSVISLFMMGVVFLALFGIISVMLGRGISGGTMLDNVGVIFSSFFRRIFSGNQIGALVGFDYVYNEPVVWGREWLQGFVGIMPNRVGSNLAHEVFEIMFGSQRGTAPVSIVASIYHNCGSFGVFLFPALYGFMCQWLFIRLIRGKKEVFRIISLFYAGVALSSWTYSGPVMILNKGFVAAAGTYLLYRMITLFHSVIFSKRPRLIIRPVNA
jgi:oligosaccharide repeat unit polymerase